jgi:hypothetical protein
MAHLSDTERETIALIDPGFYIKIISTKHFTSEIVPLRDITYIKKIADSWYMRSSFHYFEVIFF